VTLLFERTLEFLRYFDANEVCRTNNTIMESYDAFDVDFSRGAIHV
jgi:hypothetical protein